MKDSYTMHIKGTYMQEIDQLYPSTYVMHVSVNFRMQFSTHLHNRSRAKRNNLKVTFYCYENT